MRLSDLDIAQCAKCGRLVQSASAKTLCRRCDTADAGGIDESKLPADLEPSLRDKALKILEFFKEEQEPAEQCVRCHTRPPIEDSEFCLTCHFDLDNALGSATRDLFTRMELIDTDPAGPPSALSLLEEKRARTRTARINPVAARQFRRG